MKKRDVLKDGTLVVLVHCRCSVWPISPQTRLGWCGECGVRPQPIPDWSER